MDRLNLTTEAAEFDRHANAARRELSSIRALQKPERMPFTIRIVSSERDLQKAVNIRRAAYGRHLPDFAEKMTVDACDREPGTAILLAESKLDGAPLGTMRIQTNEFAPLGVEHSVRLPDHLNGVRLAEATRLGVAGGSVGRVVKMMLFKSLFLYCEQQHIDWMVITARSPLDREYETMLFEDVFGEKEFIPMAHVGGLPHRVLAGEVGVARQRWEEAGHPLFRFVFQTHHPDIDLSTADLSFERETVRCPEASQVAYGR
ncbi:N-acyl amino acid synthase FeeM domain-containing protein [Caballeronia terrestris]|nr:hypothetical protein [Caballeronia terrestris]